MRMAQACGEMLGLGDKYINTQLATERYGKASNVLTSLGEFQELLAFLIILCKLSLFCPKLNS